MKIPQPTFIILLMAFCILSCKEVPEADRVIEITPSSADQFVSLSEFVDTVMFIKLQTNESSRIGYFPQLVIREKYIYVADISQQAILMFDWEGQHIATLDKQGRGADEYLRLAPLIIDEEEEHIAMFTESSRGNVFSKYKNLTFDLVEEHPMPDISPNQHRYRNGIHYLSTQQGKYVDEKDELMKNAELIMVKDGSIERVYFEKRMDDEPNYVYFVPNMEAFAEGDSGELYLSVMYENTFYQLRGLDVHPILAIDFGRNGIDNSFRHKSFNKQQQYLQRVKNKAGFPVLSVNNSGVMAFTYYYFGSSHREDPFVFKDAEFHHYLEMKRSGKVIHAKKIRNDISQFPDFVQVKSFNYYWYGYTPWINGFLVDVIIPVNIIPEGEASIHVDGLGEITIDDNPIIVLMRLREDV